MQGKQEVLWADDELAYSWVVGVREIALSPLQDRIAFILEPEIYKSEVYILDFSTSQVTQVTNTPDILESNLKWIDKEKFSFRSEILRRDGGLDRLTFSNTTGTCIMSLSKPIDVWDAVPLDAANQTLFVSFGGIYAIDRAQLGPLEETDFYKCPKSEME